MLLASEAEAGKKKKSKKSSPSKKSETSAAAFFVGKLSAGQCLEYVDLNGLMTPTEAKKSCDEDLFCAGFTYKGAKGHNQRFDIYFFKYIPKSGVAQAKKANDWTWTSYKVQRPFVLIDIQEPSDDEKESNESGVETIVKSMMLKNPSNFEWRAPDDIAIIFNPVKEVYYRVSHKDLNLKDLLRLDLASRSIWIMSVNLQTEYSLYNQSSTVGI